MDEDLGFFYEDACDQLQYMENALLDAKDGTQDDSKIAEIFRAMHTIKGNSSMFGFDKLVSLSHKAENLLDEVRDKKVLFDADMGSIFMEVKDTISALVQESVNGIALDDNVQNTISALEEKLLNKMLGSSTDTKSKKLWHISLRLEPDFSKCLSR